VTGELTQNIGSVGAAIPDAANDTAVPAAIHHPDDVFVDGRSFAADGGTMDETATGAGWDRSPEDLQAAFATALDRFPDAERRKMFGYPAAFANGNMWTGLHQRNWVVRLPESDQGELLGIEGAAVFEPMPGRPMRGFVTLPASIRDDAERLNSWLERAFAAALAMPPKESGRKRHS
jgi:hypothetical protein